MLSRRWVPPRRGRPPRFRPLNGRAPPPSLQLRRTKFPRASRAGMTLYRRRGCLFICVSNFLEISSRARQASHGASQPARPLLGRVRYGSWTRKAPLLFISLEFSPVGPRHDPLREHGGGVKSIRFELYMECLARPGASAGKRHAGAKLKAWHTSRLSFCLTARPNGRTSAGSLPRMRSLQSCERCWSSIMTRTRHSSAYHTVCFGTRSRYCAPRGTRHGSSSSRTTKTPRRARHIEIAECDGLTRLPYPRHRTCDRRRT